MAVRAARNYVHFQASASLCKYGVICDINRCTVRPTRKIAIPGARVVYLASQARAKEAAQRSIQKIRDIVVLTVAALINQQRQPHYRVAISKHGHFPTASRLKENEGRDLLMLSKVTARAL